MFTSAFWVGVADRAVKAGATMALGLFVASGPVLNLFNVGWLTLLGEVGGAVVFSVLTSLASSQVGDKGTTSMIPGGC